MSKQHSIPTQNVQVPKLRYGTPNGTGTGRAARRRSDRRAHSVVHGDCGMQRTLRHHTHVGTAVRMRLGASACVHASAHTGLATIEFACENAHVHARAFDLRSRLGGVNDALGSNWPARKLPADLADQAVRGKVPAQGMQHAQTYAFSSAKWARRAAERRTSPWRPQRTSSSRWRCHGRYHTPQLR